MTEHNEAVLASGDLADRLEKAEAALVKIDAIRNSIIGFQNVGWSEHIYPLVAALEEAGFHGAGYDKSRADAKTMRETTIAALDRAEAAETQLKAAREALENIRELNMSSADENGHRWSNSDLIDQEIIYALNPKAPEVDGNKPS